MVSIDDTTLIAVAISIIIGTPLTFFITEYLEDRSKFKRFKTKLDTVAGVGSKLFWQGGPPGAGMHSTTGIYKVVEITREGLVLENELHKIFVPIEKVLETEIVRPSEDYERVHREQMKKDFTQVVDTMMDPMFAKLKEILVKELLTPDTELNAVVGVQVLGQLKDAGVDTSKVELKQPTLARLLAEINTSRGNPAPAVKDEAAPEVASKGSGEKKE